MNLFRFKDSAESDADGCCEALSSGLILVLLLEFVLLTVLGPGGGWRILNGIGRGRASACDRRACSHSVHILYYICPLLYHTLTTVHGAIGSSRVLPFNLVGDVVAHKSSWARKFQCSSVPAFFPCAYSITGPASRHIGHNY